MRWSDEEDQGLVCHDRFGGADLFPRGRLAGPNAEERMHGLRAVVCMGEGRMRLGGTDRHEQQQDSIGRRQVTGRPDVDSEGALCHGGVVSPMRCPPSSLVADRRMPIPATSPVDCFPSGSLLPATGNRPAADAQHLRSLVDALENLVHSVHPPMARLRESLLHSRITVPSLFPG